MKCPYCSAPLRVPTETTLVQCGYCGREIEVPWFTQEEKRLSEQMEQMQVALEEAREAVREAMDRANESDEELLQRVGDMARQMARSEQERVAYLERFRETELRAREEAHAQLNRLMDEQKRTNSTLQQMQMDYQASHAASMQIKYEQGEEAQRAGRFQDAIRHYEDLLVMNGKNRRIPEVYWRIVLCRYGVEYVREQDSGAWLPTITHMRNDRIEDDADYQHAVDFSVGRMQKYYVDEARHIDNILEKYNQVAATEKPYDVFISVKQGDDRGRPTHDSETATDIYHMLTKMGLHVFNSRISLEDKAGKEYEPYIMAALKTAKAMVVVSSSKQYINAPWVRNEWRRFRWLKENEPGERRLIVYNKGMASHEIPGEMGALQRIDYHRAAPMESLRKSMEDMFGDRINDNDDPVNEDTLKQMLQKAENLLNRGVYSECEELCNQILQNKKFSGKGKAHALRLCAKLNVRNISELGKLVRSIDGEEDYKDALKYGDDKLANELIDASENIEKNRTNDEIIVAAQRRVRRIKTFYNLLGGLSLLRFIVYPLLGAIVFYLMYSGQLSRQMLELTDNMGVSDQHYLIFNAVFCLGLPVLTGIWSSLLPLKKRKRGTFWTVVLTAGACVGLTYYLWGGNFRRWGTYWGLLLLVVPMACQLVGAVFHSILSVARDGVESKSIDTQIELCRLKDREQEIPGLNNLKQFIESRKQEHPYKKWISVTARRAVFLVALAVVWGIWAEPICDWFVINIDTTSNNMFARAAAYRYGGFTAKQDLDAAEMWYTEAADAGHEEAMYQLGQMLNNLGRYEGSLYWYERAEANGHLNAAEAAKAVKAKLPDVLSAEFAAPSIPKGTPVQVTIVSQQSAKFLHMYTESGTEQRVWEAEGNSRVADGKRIWSISYTFSNAGNRTMTFRTSSDGKNCGTAMRASIQITEN